MPPDFFFSEIEYIFFVIYKHLVRFIDTKNITLLHNIQTGKIMDLSEILEIRKKSKVTKI